MLAGEHCLMQQHEHVCIRMRCMHARLFLVHMPQANTRSFRARALHAFALCGKHVNLHVSLYVFVHVQKCMYVMFMQPQKLRLECM